MTWLWAALVLAVLGVTVAVATGRGGGMAESAPDRRETRLPAGRALTDSDLQAVRFDQKLRGYAMDEVDDFVDRIRVELATRPTGPTVASSSVPPSAPDPDAVEPTGPRPEPGTPADPAS